MHGHACTRSYTHAHIHMYTRMRVRTRTRKHTYNMSLVCFNLILLFWKQKPRRSVLLPYLIFGFVIIKPTMQEIGGNSI